MRLPQPRPLAFASRVVGPGRRVREPVQPLKSAMTARAHTSTGGAVALRAEGKHLRRQVPQRAAEGVERRVIWDGLGHAEVGRDGLEVRRRLDRHVLGLEVAVRDSALMQVGDARRGLG